MKKIVTKITTAVLLSLFITPAFALPGIWTQKANFGGTIRELAIGFSIGSKGYIGGGMHFSTNYGDFWEYDPATDVWTQKANLPNLTAQTASFGCNALGLGYAFINGHCHVYDPVANTWTQIMSLNDPDNRINGVAFCIGTKGYIGTGFDNNSVTHRDFWEFDLVNNTQTQVASLPVGKQREEAAGFATATKGYVGTGGFSINSLNDFFEFDPILNTWTQKANFGGTIRRYAVGFSIGAKGYMGTGTNASDFWEYDPALDTWTQMSNFGGGVRTNAVAFTIGTKAYAGTGNNPNDQNDFWEFDPSLTLSVNENSPENELTVFPNPVMENLFLDLKTGGTLTMYDANGAKVWSQQVVNGRNEIDMKKFSSGIYILNVKTENNGVMTKKVVKE